MGEIFKAFLIPPELSRMSHTGQVPTQDRRKTRAVEKVFDKPKAPTVDDLERDTSPRLTAARVVDGLGFDRAREQSYTKFLDEQAGSASNELRYRQSVMAKMRDDNIDSGVRRVLFDRALSFYRSRMGKSLLTLDDLVRLRKGEARGGLYFRRVATEKGNRYYYDPETYHRRDDAHISGADVLKKKAEKMAQDKIPGGLADKKDPASFDPKAVKQGEKVEAEHTDDPATAREIARDHIAEHGPEYYDKLRDMESKMSKADEEVLRYLNVKPVEKAQTLCESTLETLDREAEEAPAQAERIDVAEDTAEAGNGGLDPEDGIDMLKSFADSLEKADGDRSGEGSRGGKVIGHSSSGHPIYEHATHHEVHAWSKERYRGHGGGTRTRFVVNDPAIPGHHEYDVAGASPGARRTAALEAHKQKHGITKPVKHADFDERARKEKNAKVSIAPPTTGNTVNVAGRNGPVAVDAHHKAGNFAVHNELGGKGFAVTHTPSGMRASTHETKEAAIKYAEHMHANAGDALSDVKFGQKLGAKHAEGMKKMAAAHGSFKKSMGDPDMNLENWLQKAEGGTLPGGDPGCDSGVEVSSPKNGGKINGVGKQSGEIPAAKSPIGDVPAGEKEKLSADDAEVEKQLTDHETPMLNLLKSMDGYLDGSYSYQAPDQETARRRHAAWVAGLRKSRGNLELNEIGTEPEAPAQTPEALEKSDARPQAFKIGRGDLRLGGILIHESADEQIAKSLEHADDEYPLGVPSLDRFGGIRTK